MPRELHYHARPHDYDHSHQSVGSGWLRASVFGAMDGLVSNIGLIAGIAAAGASDRIVAITGVSGLVAGAVSMALGEFASVSTQNEQLDAEIEVERAALQRNPSGEKAELSLLFTDLGMSAETARQAVTEIHTNDEKALQVHLTHELGLSIHDRPSPWVAAISSFIFFSIGAVIPIIPFLFGFGSLITGLIFGGVGLIAVGSSAAIFTKKNPFMGGLKQLLFGGVAVAATYSIGMLLGVSAI